MDQSLPLFFSWWRQVLGISLHAAAALPLMTAFTLLLARRGHARLCTFGAARLAALGYGAAWLGLLMLCLSLYELLRALRVPQAQMLQSLQNQAALPFSLPLLCCLLGLIFAFFLARACAHADAQLNPSTARSAANSTARQDMEAHCLPVAALRKRLWLSGLTVLCFFSQYLLGSWPFSPLPPGTNMNSIYQAVFSNAVHAYFMAFAPAGAVALAALALVSARHAAPAAFHETDWKHATRWCALWATVGYIPHCLDRWGLAIGLGLRGGSLPPWVSTQLLPLTALTLAVACWTALLVMPRPSRRLWLAWLGLLLLLAARVL